MVPTRPEHRARGLRAVRPARRPRPLSPGRARRDSRGGRRSTTSRCCESTARSRTEVSAILRCRLRQGAARRLRDHRRLRLGSLRRGGRGVPLRARASRASSSGSTGAPPAGARPRVRAPRRLTPRASVRRQSRDLSLTVLVVFHNMRREAARTLHSLSRAYQRDIDNLDYEVIAIENGSATGRPARRGLRPELRPGVQLPRPRRAVATLPRARPQPRARSLPVDARSP